PPLVGGGCRDRVGGPPPRRAPGAARTGAGRPAALPTSGLARHCPGRRTDPAAGRIPPDRPPAPDDRQSGTAARGPPGAILRGAPAHRNSDPARRRATP